MNLPRNWNFIAAMICVVFVAVALTFGMSEWKSGTPATATAPASSTVR